MYLGQSLSLGADRSGWRIAQVLASGKTTREAAAALFLSQAATPEASSLRLLRRRKISTRQSAGQRCRHHDWS